MNKNLVEFEEGHNLMNEKSDGIEDALAIWGVEACNEMISWLMLLSTSWLLRDRLDCNNNSVNEWCFLCLFLFYSKKERGFQLTHRYRKERLQRSYFGSDGLDWSC